MKANDIIQMSIKDIKRSIPSISMESVLKINKTISKERGRYLESFDVDYAKVLRENELQPIKTFLFKTDPIKQESVDNVILSVFGDGFRKELNIVKENWVKKEYMQKIQIDYGLSGDDLVIYLAFLRSVINKVYSNKVSGPFISRISASITRCKNFILHFLNVLRKLPCLDEGAFDIKTKLNTEEFKVGESFVFPSFVLGTKYNSGDKEIENKIILRLSGKTSKGHVLEGYIKRIIIEPETSFRVTKIEQKESSCIVYGEFIEKEGMLLENEVKEYEKKLLEPRDNDALPVIPTAGPKYVVKYPDSLSEIMELEKDYKGMSLKDAIRKANFTDSDILISKAEEKKEKLQRILKDFDLSEEDIMAIYIYTLEDEKKKEDSPYRVLNNALSNRSKESLLPLREYMFYLLMGLRNLPKFRKQNVLYRGIRMSKKEFMKTYLEGSILFWTTFTSTSTDEGKAFTFTKEIGKNEGTDECGVIFEIHGKFRGYSIGSFSDFPNEEEILLEPDTKFTVMMVSQDEKNPDMMRVVLSVKDEEPILKKELAQFESCCEEIIIEEECRRIKDNNEQGRNNFNNQEPSSINIVAQDRGEVKSVKNEQQFSSSPMQSRGDVKATENEQGRSSISNMQNKGNVSSFPMRGEIHKTTTGNKEQPSHPTLVRGSVTTINNKRELPIPMRGGSPSVNGKRALPIPVRGMTKIQEKRVLPLPFRGGVQKKQLP